MGPMLTAALEAILLSQLQSPLSHQGHPDPVIPGSEVRAATNLECSLVWRCCSSPAPQWCRAVRTKGVRLREARVCILVFPC